MILVMSLKLSVLPMRRTITFKGVCWTSCHRYENEFWNSCFYKWWIVLISIHILTKKSSNRFKSSQETKSRWPFKQLFPSTLKTTLGIVIYLLANLLYSRHTINFRCCNQSERYTQNLCGINYLTSLFWLGKCDTLS